jgi:hypothetical protein
MKVLINQFRKIKLFKRKERKGNPQRTQFSLCALCVTFAPFALKTFLAAITFMLFSCGKPLMEVDDNTLLPIVECYLQEGSDNVTVSVFSMEEFLKDDIKLSRPISKLNVFVNDVALTETSSGIYSLSLDEESITEGQTYRLQFNHNGKSIEATTTIPSPIRSLAVEPQSITLSSSYFWDFSDTTQVVVTWDDPDNGFYQVYIDSPNNPDMPSMGVFRHRMMQPFQGNTHRLSTRELRSTGTHTIYVYRVGQDYAELYERISASDLANPVSFLQNAFGIFTSISVARITVRVYDSG